MPPTPTSPRRSLLLVAGSGRSGTSVFSGIMQRLGYFVPPPEIPADETNPLGFAESQWVVDFHTKLLRSARVQVSDARPAAWARTAQAALDPSVQAELRRWLDTQFGRADHVVVKDPRLAWFLPLWRQRADELGVATRFATMLRHPAATVHSKERWYGGWQGSVSLTAGWVNLLLFTERATRDAPRAFVPYEALLDDWVREIGRVAEALDLAVVRDAGTTALAAAHAFVDRDLSRSNPSWERVDVPTALRELADEVWALLLRLAESDEDDPAQVIERLDEARAAYTRLYAEAEAIAQSSVWGAAARAKASRVREPNDVIRVVQRVVPKHVRHMVPARFRHEIVRALVHRS